MACPCLTDLIEERNLGLMSEREKEVLEGRFGLHEREPAMRDVMSARLGLICERVRHEALI